METREITTILANDMRDYQKLRDSWKKAVDKGNSGCRDTYLRFCGCCSAIQGIITQIDNAGA